MTSHRLRAEGGSSFRWYPARGRAVEPRPLRRPRARRPCPPRRSLRVGVDYVQTATSACSAGREDPRYFSTHAVCEHPARPIALRG
jgi:hypothetical protein